ncbi:hypothetical protein OG203_36870 [Nocardia sp. NBC_01499]|uniref:hypothetical protein n=1 Tax=Nocardia sp. NBC_01499 TaxID=2903597 RepID=UPI003868E2A7
MSTRREVNRRKPIAYQSAPLAAPTSLSGAGENCAAAEKSTATALAAPDSDIWPPRRNLHVREPHPVTVPQPRGRTARIVSRPAHKSASDLVRGRMESARRHTMWAG